MKVRHARKALPRLFHRLRGARILGEAELQITRRGRLRAKLLLFATMRDFRHFWREVMGRRDPGSRCLAQVDSMTTTRFRVEADGTETGHYLEVDPRYFCVISLVRGHTGMEVLSHEAVHAGYCYAKRVARTPFEAARHFDEEEIAYPAGRVARWMNVYLHDNGFHS